MREWRSHDPHRRYTKSRVKQELTSCVRRKSRLQIVYSVLFILAALVILVTLLPIPDEWVHDVVGGRANPHVPPPHPLNSKEGRSKRDAIVSQQAPCPPGTDSARGDDVCVKTTYFPDPYDPSLVDESADPCDSFYSAHCGAFVSDPTNTGTHHVFSHLRSVAMSAANEIIEQELQNSPSDFSNPVKEFYESCVDGRTRPAFSVDEGATTRAMLAPMSKVADLQDVVEWMGKLFSAGVDTPFYLTLMPDAQRENTLQYTVVPGTVAPVIQERFVSALSSVYGGALVSTPLSKALEFQQRLRVWSSSCTTHVPVRDAGVRTLLAPFLSGVFGGRGGGPDSQEVAVTCPSFFREVESALRGNLVEHAVAYLAYKIVAAAEGVEPQSQSGRPTRYSQWNSFYATESDWGAMVAEPRGSATYCKALTRVIMERHIEAELSVAAFSGAAGRRIRGLFEALKMAVARQVDAVYAAVGIGERTRQHMAEKMNKILLVTGDTGSMRDRLMSGDVGVSSQASLADNVWAMRGWYMDTLKRFMEDKAGGANDAEWHEESLYMPPQVEPVAYYSHDLNTVFVTAAMVGAGMFSPAYTDTAVAARLGFVFSHELAHAADAIGLASLPEWSGEAEWSGRLKDVLSLEDGMACGAAVVQNYMKNRHGVYVPAARMMNEVFADLVAVRALGVPDDVPSPTFLNTFAQGFCEAPSRESLDDEAARMTHPFADARCDACVSAWARVHAPVYEPGACAAGSAMATLQNKLAQCKLL